MITFSSTVMRGKARTTWNVRPMPSRQTACGFRPTRFDPAKPMLARMRLQEAVDDIEQRGLAGTVGADDAVDHAFHDGEVDIIDGLEPAEGP